MLIDTLHKKRKRGQKMSINSRMKTFEVWENKQVNDKWGATTNELVKVDTARVSISTKSTLNINKDMKYAEVTHIGLTENRNLKRNQVLCLDALRYIIYEVPNNMGRLTQLLLKEVVE